ncbi:type II secretion system F family protein [Antribacter sp. KLBMP9083]|uniref:Type II secretion system F family protein n=1 Tax=Antribacter soli TaxID=2910976 RepID=A0AA41QG28_9MICO|nr:type II secretion system F family protein [Antribacter soli]MCF4122809.1 type II secretion system F family protein [Antribacter soli]
MNTIVLVGLAAVGVAVLTGVYLFVAPSGRLPLERRRPVLVERPGMLGRGAAAATSALDALLRRRGRSASAGIFERAGVRMSRQDLVFLQIIAAVCVLAAGLLLGSVLVGILLAILVPILTRVGLAMRTSRRQSAFADQLDDSLQLIAGSLRAGHSLLQSLASVAHEAEEPTSDEFSRVVNEVRVGRDLGEALDEVAARMGSQDFFWVAQAIAINREVGGNLADVLEGVSKTIRERNQVRRQVRALAAEGKLSAVVLMALPIGIIGFLAVVKPTYVGAFFGGLLGYLMLAAGVFLLVVGGFWLRRVVRVSY